MIISQENWDKTRKLVDSSLGSIEGLFRDLVRLTVSNKHDQTDFRNSFSNLADKIANLFEEVKHYDSER